MADFFRHPLLLSTFWFAAILALLALAVLLLRKFRDGDADDRSDASEDLSKFRELHSRGGLSDDEYRTIKTKLASQLSEAGDIELSDSEQTS